MKPYHVSWMTQKQANEHVRRVYNVPDDVGLGWRPYKILITQSAISCRAFNTVAGFREWLRRNNLTFEITGRFLGDGIGNRTGYARSGGHNATE